MAPVTRRGACEQLAAATAGSRSLTSAADRGANEARTVVQTAEPPHSIEPFAAEELPRVEGEGLLVVEEHEFPEIVMG